MASLPDAPGVYVFKDQQGETIYIGKAVSLRNRVRSYWSGTSWRERPKLAVMMPRVESLETILTNSEKEALLLEATLIRKHMPRYNVALKDDKRYPWLAITYDEPFPRLIMIRDPFKFRRGNPAAKIFGPYVEAGMMWETVKVLRKVFPLRQRAKPLFKDRPCMNYHIGLCLAPCQKLVTEAQYTEMVRQMEMFLSGRQTEVLSAMRKAMEAQAEALQFEEAARLRDSLLALQSVVEKQQVFFQDQTVNQDIIAEAHTEKHIMICLMRIRQGKLINSEAFDLVLADRTRFDEAFVSFCRQYYAQCEDISIPREVLLQHALEDGPALGEMLSQRSDRQVKVLVPSRGAKLKLIEMAQKNASLALEKHIKDEADLDASALGLLTRLKDELKLDRLPRRIECFDISNIQGTDNVASLVVFENGQCRKSDYRHFKIQSQEGQANDFASMKEVVSRRYRRLLSEGKKLPDLIIIDGGKGQLNAALEALAELPVSGLPVLGLAKKQEEIWLPGSLEPVLLSRRSEALHLLQRVRDEAHRFAVTFHRKLRARRSLKSDFDGLPGVGESRRKKLMLHFGSFESLKKATEDELAATEGISRALASKIWACLQERHQAD